MVTNKIKPGHGSKKKKKKHETFDSSYYGIFKL